MIERIHLFIAVAMCAGLSSCERDESAAAEFGVAPKGGARSLEALGESATDEQKAAWIGERMHAAGYAWFQLPEHSRPLYGVMQQRFVNTLSDEEIQLAGQFQPDPDFNECVFRRWAGFDPEAALGAARGMEDANAAEISLAGTGLEGGPGEAMSAHVFEMFIGAVDGWANDAPKAAWKAFKNQEGPFADSQVVEDFSSYFYEVLFEHLAKEDGDFAFSELLAPREDPFERSYMLEGFLRGAPRGRDWREDVERLLKVAPRPGTEETTRCALMGRWLEDDAEAAEAWFRDGDVADLHWSYSDLDPWGGALDPFAPGKEEPVQERVRERNGLGEAAGYWAAQDFSAAFRWMQNSEGGLREGFELSVLQGASDRLDGEGEAREHFRDGLAKLPDQSDRDQGALLFATQIWEFDGTEFLGEDPPDKEKWLEGVREQLAPLRLSEKVAERVIEKLRSEPPRLF